MPITVTYTEEGLTVSTEAVSVPCSDEVWRSRATSGAWQERAAAAKEWEGLTISLAKKLARDSDIRVKEALGQRTASRPLPESVIADLFSSHTPAVREALARGIQPLTDKQHSEFIRCADTRIRVAYARSSRPLSEAITREAVANLDESALYAFLETGRPIPDDLQISLARSSFQSIKWVLASVHGGRMLLCDDAHLILALDLDNLVREAARGTITVDVLTFAANHEDTAINEAASAFVISLAISDIR